MRNPMRLVRNVSLITAVILGGYAALLCSPQPLFPYSVRAANLTLYSDRMLPEQASTQVLALARSKLATCPLFSEQTPHKVFICNARWRQMLLFNKSYGAGGVAEYPVTSVVFLRGALVERNALLSPRGTPVPGDRTLSYFVAHEITHQLTGEALGPIAFLRLPQWVREGYADYVAKQGSFDYLSARRAYLAGAPEMDFKRTGMYSGFHVQVAYLLDRNHWTVEKLLKTPPEQSVVDAAIRTEQP